MPIRVLLAEDHERVRDAIGRHLSSDPDIEVVAIAHEFSVAIELCPQLRPDVVLLDLHMADENSVSPEQVKAGFSQSRVIAMSVWIDDETKQLADSFGALVLLDKTSLSADLIPAIKLCAKV
jgi:DNA-binding NarL/FixJ family response regulator